jgi:hypothetical protein
MKSFTAERSIIKWGNIVIEHSDTQHRSLTDTRKHCYLKLKLKKKQSAFQEFQTYL